ncbi:hypothetical protein J7384_08980 [Endozoicomonas sp. G2_1]|uniref:RIFT barrel domain-containing protein n=1 Tax=Endozoicomonas sp. G2_1 TaxID=2821091 RepID=UPI001ADC829A|nr:hypothetical protein [Endozoicomonas sp. G2_1]MBO9490495.1 hypothetical protein [Endozoicomonas sp. G2_1]
MLEVPFKITKKNSTDETNPYVCFSLPVGKGQLYSADELTVERNQNELVDADFDVLARWPDKSIKWFQCKFFDSLTNDSSYVVKQVTSKLTPSSTAVPVTIESQDSIIVKTEGYQYQLNKNKLAINNLSCSLELNDQKASKLVEKVTCINYDNKIKRVSNTLKYEGRFTSGDIVVAEYDADLTFFAKLPIIKLALTLRNPKPMIHHGGKWDLGNENSFLFNSLGLIFNQVDNTTTLRVSPSTSGVKQNGNFTLYQASSGGENWQSTNHVNANNKVVLPFKGYQHKYNETSQMGDRAAPTIAFKASQNTITVHLEDFWQNFPKALSKNSDKLTIGLFPDEHIEPHELLPGEQKTHTVWLSLEESYNVEAFANHNRVVISPEYLSQTNAIPFFATQEDVAQDNIDRLIQLGLTHENNFFAKREQIDEYGWRNFGDLYADHETLEYQGDEQLISHYNNQYDPLYGFLRQYLYSGDSRWLTLANDLATHVKDIDIYHTNDDKAEYNNGLFWHTDHYLPAITAGHRTYSKFQQANAYQDHSAGGGPGGQHCYTTGLMLHYFLTGSSSSKSAVLKLANWVSAFYEGDGTFLDALLRIKQSNSIGNKNVIMDQYPLDRGTGHYVVALIDAFEVSGEQSYLDKAGLVIKKTIFADEKVASRNLDNVEETWFYTVFLQAVSRYLITKEHNSQFDSAYHYAGKALLTFAYWMGENEKPYLDTPEILEYPNHTWAAQDIRKANVLYFASRYLNEDKKEQALAAADKIYQYVGNTLIDEDTHYFTRILSILMQNHGVKEYSQDSYQNSKLLIQNKRDTKSLAAQPTNNKRNALKLSIKRLAKSSLKKEVNWLRKRVSKFDKLLKTIAE